MELTISRSHQSLFVECVPLQLHTIEKFAILD